jgi:hypothetical protein
MAQIKPAGRQQTQKQGALTHKHCCNQGKALHFGQWVTQSWIAATTHSGK